MNNNNLIPTQIICTQYNIEISFVDALHKMGLIKIDIIEHHPFIHQDQIGDLEKMDYLINLVLFLCYFFHVFNF